MEQQEIRVSLNLNVWSYREFAQFKQAVMEGYFHDALLIILPCIVQWTVDSNITPDAVDRLPLPVIFNLANNLMEQLGNVVSNMSIDDVSVNLNNWVGKEYSRFVTLGRQPVLSDKEVSELEGLFRKVGSFEGGFEREDELTAVEGWKISAALGPEIEKYFRKDRNRRGNVSKHRV